MKHRWLSGENATDHNLLPEIKAYMAKARLRRGIELVKLTNRIEALKMQEEDPENSDMPSSAVPEAERPAPVQSNAVTSSGSDSGTVTGKQRLTNAVKGAIFREVVLAKVREMKQQEEVRKEVEEAGKQDTASKE